MWWLVDIGTYVLLLKICFGNLTNLNCVMEIYSVVYREIIVCVYVCLFFLMCVCVFFLFVCLLIVICFFFSYISLLIEN